MKIVESITGNWFYHISETGKNMQPALCGNTQVMESYLKLSDWGTVSHLNEKYCKQCQDVLNKLHGGTDGTVKESRNH